MFYTRCYVALIIMETGQSIKTQTYKVGEIVKYTRYVKGELPKKYFKCKKVDADWGVVDYGEDTVGMAYVTKTNFIEKVIWWLFF